MKDINIHCTMPSTNNNTPYQILRLNSIKTPRDGPHPSKTNQKLDLHKIKKNSFNTPDKKNSI